MSTFRVHFYAMRGRRREHIDVPFALTAHQAVIDAQRTAAATLPGYRYASVEQLPDTLAHAPVPYSFSAGRREPPKSTKPRAKPRA